ncbi:protein YgfX [Thiothrix caldifontis]|nr:protein YgfX [Thiothrix caldifontis]
MDNQPPLYLQPGASRRLAVFILASHLLTAVVVGLMPALPWWGKGFLLVLIVMSLRYYWRLHISRVAPNAVQEVRFYQVDNALVRTASAGFFARLDDSSFLHPWVCVLNWRTLNGKLYSLIVMSDSVPPDVLRQLRVRVKFSPADMPKK